MTDPRVTCTACQHYRRGNSGGMSCTRALAAGLSRTARYAEVGRQFATLLQRCSAHESKEAPHAPARG